MNKIIRTLICDGQISLTVLQTSDIVSDAIKIHGLNAPAAKILGGMLTCCAYMSSALKSDGGSVSLTVKAKDGDGAVSVSGDALLNIRGYADGSCEKTLAGGSLTVVRDDGFSAPFVGACEIKSDDVSDILAAYFQQSEQIPTAVHILTNIDDKGKCVFSGGVVLQLLPDADDVQIGRAERAYESFVKKADAFEKIGADGVFARFFAPLLSGEESYTLVPRYACNCSERKIRAVLYAVGKEELLKIAREEGCVKVHCHYCNKDYIYDEKTIGEIFDV